MSAAQPGIFALGTRVHHHLEFEITDESALLERVTAARESLGTVRGVNVVTGVAPGVWARLRPGHGPVDAADFEPMSGAEHAYPAAQHGIWFWLHGADIDGVFDAARSVVSELAPVAVLAAECRGFAYGASQDLTGFEDGTENPPLDEAVELLGADPIALVQRWVHDLAAFGELSTDEAEAVIGRTLHGSEELDDAPPSAHIECVVIDDDDGDELEVFRRSVPFGDVGEHGLQFVGFSPDRARLHRMLEGMLGIDDGTPDALNRFSTPVSGAYYIVPGPASLGV